MSFKLPLSTGMEPADDNLPLSMCELKLVQAVCMESVDFALNGTFRRCFDN